MKKCNKHWSRRLTKDERDHLKETGCNLVSLEPFKRNLKAQQRDNTPCLECNLIANKLGVVV